MGQLNCCPIYSMPKEEQKKITETTGFPKNRVYKLFRKFETLDTSRKRYLCKADMAPKMDFSETSLAPLVLDAFFFPPWNLDPKTAPLANVTFEHFCQVFSLFQPHHKQENWKEDENYDKYASVFLFRMLTQGDHDYVTLEDIGKIAAFVHSDNNGISEFAQEAYDKVLYEIQPEKLDFDNFVTLCEKFNLILNIRQIICVQLGNLLKYCA